MSMPPNARNETLPVISITSSQLKRTTCDLCRERKVRCDRTKPECLRCTRSGYQCTYPSANGEAAKINMALQSLHARLQQAENRLQTESNAHNNSSAAGSLEAATIDLDNKEGFSSALQGDLDLGGSNDIDFAYPWEQLVTDDFAATFQQTGEDTPPYDNVSNANEFSANPYAAAMPRSTTSKAGATPTAGDVPQALQQSNPLAWTGQPSPPSTSTSTSSSTGTRRAFGSLPSDTFQLSPEMFKMLCKSYFDVVQRHMLLVDKDSFMRLSMASKTSQTQALAYAICMAGAHVGTSDAHLEEQCYLAARHHLEQAELESQGSCFWTLEAAQALVLVARYEFTHVSTPRAFVTLARLEELLKILQYHQPNDVPMSPRDGSPAQRVNSNSDHFSQVIMQDADKQHEMQRTFFIALSMRWRKSLGKFSHEITDRYPIYTQLPRVNAATQAHQRKSLVFDAISQPMIEKLDSFSLFIVSLRVASDANRHHQETAADMTGTTIQYNFCRNHDQIETEIGTFVMWLTSIPVSAAVLSGRGTAEMRVLAMIIALGCRIQLYNTAILHARMAKFLDPVVAECRNQNAFTANDISDFLLQTNVLDPSRISVYREASFFIMPSLALAAEAHLLAARSSGGSTKNKNTDDSSSYTSYERRRSLEVIYMVMEACRDDTDLYDSYIRDCRLFLEATRHGKQLRTDFTSFSGLRNTNS